MLQTVRVLLAVSSPLTLKILERLLAEVPDIEVVGVARRGRDVVAMVEAHHPHIVCVDDAPPMLDGLEASDLVMRTHPCPILVISATCETKRRDALLEVGALDCCARPDGTGPREAASFVTRLKMLSRVPVIGRRPSGHIDAPLRPASSAVQSLVAPVRPFAGEATLNAPVPRLPLVPDKGGERIIAIGASTGGPIALMAILSALPANFPYPIVCVQHVSHGFLEGLISWLDEGCRVRVTIAEAGELARAGTVLFPPEDRHMEVGLNGRIRTTEGPPRDGHRPSATVLFESVAQSYGARATAILLTGMGADGASGLGAVREAGGDTIAQSEASCVVFGMPRVAIENGAARHIGSPDEIVRRLRLLI